ncbi:MAG: FAD/NAD(P)-binding oxidoreductase, partial [Pseudomonadota bacterium]
MASDYYDTLILGGGAAGITVAASLRKRWRDEGHSIAVLEPSSAHYYQPAFTLVGAGAITLESTRRSTESLIPRGVSWIKDWCVSIEPENNRVNTQAGHVVSYKHLVVATGVELNWDKISGLKESLGQNGVCSNYSADTVESTLQSIRRLKSGDQAVFTQAPLPFKCPGAPQKIAYLTADYLSKNNIGNINVSFNTHGPGIFGVPYYAERLVPIAERHGIAVNYQKNLVAVDGAAREAEFEFVSEERRGEKEVVKFDMLHVTPPQSPAAFIRESSLANEAGYVDIDQHTLRSTKFNNVFALGDVGSSPNSKTAAAVRKQAPVVVQHLIADLKGVASKASYDGYASCPLTTAFGKTIIAEFIYGGKPTPTLPLNPGKEWG